MAIIKKVGVLAPKAAARNHILSVNVTREQLDALKRFAHAQGFASVGRWLKAFLEEEIPDFPPSATWGGRRIKNTKIKEVEHG
jgi:hypothetical protein